MIKISALLPRSLVQTAMGPEGYPKVYLWLHKRSSPNAAVCWWRSSGIGSARRVRIHSLSICTARRGSLSRKPGQRRRIHTCEATDIRSGPRHGTPDATNVRCISPSCEKEQYALTWTGGVAAALVSYHESEFIAGFSKVV